MTDQKQKLIAAAEIVGFVEPLINPEAITNDFSNYTDEDRETLYYLYLHEYKRWFKTEHDVDVWAEPGKFGDSEIDQNYNYFVFNEKEHVEEGHVFMEEHEALEAGLLKAVEVVKEVKG